MFRKTLACAAAVALLLAAGGLTPAARADTFFYGAVNETLFDCLDRYMPVDMQTGVVVPSRLLVDGGIGLRESFDPASRVYTLSDASYSLTFDIGRGLTYDSGQQYDEKAFDTLAGVVYLPLDFIRKQFGLTYRFVEHGEYGIILRVCHGGAVSPDDEFMSRVENQLARQQARYREINNLPPRPGGGAPVSPGAVTPTPPPIPVPAPPPEVALVVDVNDAGAALLEETLGVLDGHGVPAAVFFTRGALDYDHALTRRALARYTPGVLYDGPEEGEGGSADILDALNDANRVLRQAALTQTRFARLYAAPISPAGGTEATATADRLYQAGYRLWRQDIDLPAVKRERDINKAVGDLMKKIGDGADGDVRVLRADCREFGPALLDALLTRLDEANAVFLEIGY